MSFMYPDTVEITPVTKDATYGTKTEGTAYTTKARVENKQAIVNGQERSVEFNIIIALPRSTNVQEGFYLSIVKSQGVIVNTRKREIQQVFKVGGGFGHIEARFRDAR